MDKRKKRASHPCYERVLRLSVVFLVIGLAFYSVTVTRLYSREIHLGFKRIFLGWNECDDYNRSNVTIYIQPHKITTLIEPDNVCPNSTKHIKNNLLFLVFVLSAINHFEVRNSIRHSWGSYNNYKTTQKLLADLRVKYTQADYPYFDKYGEVDVKALKKINEREENLYFLKYKKPVFRVVFALGKPGPDDIWSQKHIDEEAMKYNDIIQEDFVDTYQNLTLKNLMMIKWVINNCGDSVRYIMKSDDDAFVNMNLMVENLQNRAEEFDDTTDPYEEEYALFGLLRGGGNPNRDEKAKHFVPVCYYPNGTLFPAYLSGACGYVMSMPVAYALYKASWNTPYMNLEDIYTTGLLPRRSVPRMRLEHDASFREIVRTMYTTLRTCVFMRRSSIGSIDLRKMAILQKRLVDIVELQKLVVDFLKMLFKDLLKSKT